MSELRLHLPDAEATLNLGAHLARLLCAPESPRTVLLFGDMGSGKTTLVRGLVGALPGSEDAEIASPSFTLINSYPTTPPVLHADLFRCEPETPDGYALPGSIPDELDEALCAPAGQGMRSPLVLIEWAERLPCGLRPAERLDILMQPCHSARLFLATAHGDAAHSMCENLKQVLSAADNACLFERLS